MELGTLDERLLHVDVRVSGPAMLAHLVYERTKIRVREERHG